jgi:transposase-like protein
MIVQAACQASSRFTARALATESLSRPKCPGCGSILLVAEESRFDAGRIVHQWACDQCGKAFATSIRLGLR